MAIIRINKLFGYYTNEIDLSKRCNIIIGENGLGKTSILKIISNLIKGDFINICQNYFESIEIIEGEEIITIKIADLFPDIKTIITMIMGNELYDNLIYDQNLYDHINNIEKQLLEIINACGNSAYYKAISDIYFNRPVDPVILKILPEKEQVNIQEYTYHIYIRNSLNRLYKSSGGKYFSGTKINYSQLLSKIHEMLQIKKCYYVDLVEKYFLSETQISQSNVFNYNIKWISEYKNVYLGEDFLDNDRSSVDFWERRLSFPPACGNKRIGLGCHISKEMIEPFVQIAKVAYKNPNYFFDRFTNHHFMKNLIEDKRAEINMVIRDFYYPQSFIKEINNIAISYYYDIIGEEIGEGYQDINKFIGFYSKNYLDINNYFMPIVIRHSIFDMDFESLAEDPFYPENVGEKLHKAFINFFNNEFDKLRTNRSEKIATFERLLKKYLFNKEVKIYPSGLKVFVKNRSTKTHKSGLKVYENFIDEVNLNSLSSGEKKIIILLFLAIFMEEETLLIDEPELSLSIVWQKMLLLDLLNETRVKKIIVCTHSPFIAEDETLHQYLLPLSTEEGEF